MEVTKNYKNMPVIYVAGPFRGKQEGNFWQIHQNIERAAAIAHEVWVAGGACICPHLNTSPFQGSLPDSVWMDGDLAILARCDAILMMDTWRESEGATEEHTFAEFFGIPVINSIPELKRWISYYRGEDDAAWRNGYEGSRISDRGEKQSLWKSIGGLWAKHKNIQSD